MHDGRVPFVRLHQVGQQRVLQQQGHRPVRLQVRGRHGGAVHPLRHHDPPQPRLQVGVVRGQRQDGHHLARRRDVEPLLAGDAIGRAAQADDALAQGAVVQVEDARPEDPLGVDAELVALLEGVVHHGREQVVRAGDCVQVPGEVQVDGVHRQHLAVAAARGAALHAEDRTHGRFPDRAAGVGAGPAQRLGQADRGHRLPLPERRRVDPRHQHQGPPPRPALCGPPRRRGLGGAPADLGHPLGAGGEVRGREAEAGGYLH